MNGYARYDGFAGSTAGVASLNGETGALNLVAGTGIAITPSGQNITISNTEAGGSVTSVSVVTANGFAGSVANPTTTPAITLSTTITGILQGNGTAISAATVGNLTDAGTDGIVVTGGTGAVLGSGTSIAQFKSSASQNGYLSSTDWSTFNSKQAAGNYITALTGDGTASGPGSVAFTLATVNSNTGSFGSSTSIPSFIVNGKGLITSASSNVVIAPAGTLTGSTLASGVTASSLTSLGTQAQALNMGGFQINNGANPTSAQDFATKFYVDNIAAAVEWRAPAQAYSSSNVPLTGASTLTIDGYSVQNGNSVILANQTTSSQNGIYTVTGIGTAYVLTLRETAVVGYSYLVLNGTQFAYDSFTVASISPTVYHQFGGPTEYSFTSPLVQTGTTISIASSPAFSGTASSANYNVTGNYQINSNPVVSQPESTSLWLGDAVSPSITSATKNIVIATSYTSAITSGSSNFIAGHLAGQGLITGSNNVLIGEEAGQLLTSSNAVFIGYQAGQNNTGGGGVAVGQGAAMGSGSYSATNFVAIGNGALNIMSGNGTIKNTAVGAFSLDQLTTATLTTAVGYQAGHNGVTTNGTNTFLGALSDVNTSGSVTGATAIGYQALVYTSNTIALGATGASVAIGEANAGSLFARFMLPAGTATANSAPLKFTSGTLLTTPEAGAMEYLSGVLYYTDSTPSRKQIANTTIAGGGTGNNSISYTTLTDGATITWTVAGIVNNAEVTLGGNRTLAFSGIINGMTGTIVVKQDATGSRTLALPSGSKVIGGGAGAVTLSTAANAIDILCFTYDGTNYFWTYGQNYT